MKIAYISILILTVCEDYIHIKRSITHKRARTLIEYRERETKELEYL